LPAVGVISKSEDGFMLVKIERINNKNRDKHCFHDDYCCKLGKKKQKEVSAGRGSGRGFIFSGSDC